MDPNEIAKMQGLLQQAQQMQHSMEQKLAETVVEASAGGGVVSVRMNGRKEVIRIKIDPNTMGSTGADIELLEDLIAAAVNEAGRRADQAMKSSVQGMLGGMVGPDFT